MALSNEDRKLAAKVGKQFEKDIQDVLIFAASSMAHACQFYRLYDTHAAGNFLPEAPADFIGAAPIGPVLIEAKSSVLHQSLRSCLSANVDFGQAAQGRLWEEKGYTCLYLFLDYRGQQIEAWSGGVVGRARAEGIRLRAEQCLARFPAIDLQDWLTNYLTRSTK